MASNGQFSCSNGVVICGADVPLSNGEKVSASITHVYDSDRLAFIVFADLAQATFRAQRYDAERPEIEAEWFVPKPQQESDDWPVVLPNYYKLIGCQKGGEMQAGRLTP